VDELIRQHSASSLKKMCRDKHVSMPFLLSTDLIIYNDTYISYHHVM